MGLFISTSQFGTFHKCGTVVQGDGKCWSITDILCDLNCTTLVLKWNAIYIGFSSNLSSKLLWYVPLAVLILHEDIVCRYCMYAQQYTFHEREEM